MGIGEALAKGFGTAKKGKALVLLLFAFGFAFNLAKIFLAPAAPDATAPPEASPLMIVIGVVFIFFTIFLQGGSMAFIRDLIKTGSASMANFTAGGSRYYLKLLVLGLVVSLIIGVCVLLAALAAGLLQAIPALGVPLAILFAALGLYFVVLLFLSPYAAVVDELGVGAAIKRSMKLVKRNILKLLGLSLILIVIGFGVGLILGAILAGISLVVKAETPVQIIFSLLSSLVNSFLGVLVTSTFMNFYLSLTDRNNT